MKEMNAANDRDGLSGMNDRNGQKVFRGVKWKFPEAFKVDAEPAAWPLASLPDDHVLIRTAVSLISPGTELALFTGTHVELPNPANRWAKLPFFPGYASVGEVIAAGRSVCGITAGMRVLATGHHATYDCIPYAEHHVVPLPNEAIAKHVLFAKLAEIATASTVQARIAPGHLVVVFGLGLIGNLAAQLFALQGARVIGVDVVERRVAAARDVGIERTVHSTGMTEEELAAHIEALAGGEAPHVVVEATGNPALVTPALQLVRPLGQVILLGSPRASAEIDLYRHIHSRGVSLIGAHNRIKGLEGVPAEAHTLRYVLDLIVRRQLAVEPLITHMLSWTEAARAYELLLHDKDKAIGVLLDWTDASRR